MKKYALVILLGFILVLVVGCVITGPATAPPPPKREIRPNAPSTSHIWISGHWKWNGARYIWLSGHYVKKKPGRTWIGGHWVKRGRHYVWIKGHWR